MPTLKHWVLMHTLLFLHRKAELSDTSSVLEAFKFIENAGVEFSDEDEEEDSEGKDRTHVESRTVRKQSGLTFGTQLCRKLCLFCYNSHNILPQIMRKKPSSSTSPASMDTSEDPDAEEALKGFDFLSSTEEMDTSPESRGTGDGTDWGESWIRVGTG